MTRAERIKRVMSAHIDTVEVAGMLGVPVYTARRWLVKEKACRKVGHRWITTYALLQRAFPELANRVMQEALEGGE